ncbi:DUF971 domain-containing protein [Bacteroidota bacterium]
MQELKPKKITRPEPKLLSIIWNDGLETVIELKRLRDNCPCAQCTTGDKGKSKFDEWVESSLKDEKYKLQEIKLIGNYALRPVWADGHDVGLYRWEHLREVCEKNNISKS